jgi:hypothetical protein
VNAILDQVHQTIMGMLHTADIDMADTVNEIDIAEFLTNATWSVCSTYYTVLKISPGEATFGQDMLFGVPFFADWSKIGAHRQKQTDKNMDQENRVHVDWVYQPSNKVLLHKDGILFKTEKTI